LAKAGFGVEVLGAWIDPVLKERDQALLGEAPFKFTSVLDATRDRWLWLKSRLRARMAREWHRRTGRETAWQLGYTVGALVRAARQRKADLFIAHSEPALWALTQIRNHKSEIGNRKFGVSVDMEDWFSEDLTAEARKQRPVQLLKSLEQRALSQASHSTCTSRAMSEALAREYGCRPPAVIYNAFPWADRQKLDGQFKDRRDLRVPSLHWYSQTLGYGRGLEDLFAALPHIRHPLQIHLRGKPMVGFDSWLQQQLPENWRSRVFVHSLVSNDELLSRIAEHDIGFAGEQKYSRSRDLTVTNKILHYMLGGLAVLASDTAGQREVSEQATNAVRIYPAGDSLALARELNKLLASAEALQAAKAPALRAAEQTFCWEHQMSKLINAVALAGGERGQHISRK